MIYRLNEIRQITAYIQLFLAVPLDKLTKSVLKHLVQRRTILREEVRNYV